MKLHFHVLLLALILCIPFKKIEAQESISNGFDVINAMYEKYEGKWYKNLTFTQKTSFYGQKGNLEREQMWYEAMTMPGRLAIKFDDKQSNNGILFNNGIQYGYANGQLIQEVKRTHELLVLGFDIYHQDPNLTATQLSGNGYDLDKMYEDVWQSRPVYVLGVDAPDSTKPQIWVDKERLYFVRNITIGRQNTIQEVQFNKYERLGQGWIAPEVIFKANGYLGLLEEYSQIVIPDSIDAEIYNPVMFTETDW